MEIRALDTSDTAQVAAWHSVLHDGYTSGRPPVWWSGLEAEVYALPGEPFEESRAGRFALAQGLRAGNVETRYLLDLRAHAAPPAPEVPGDTEVVGWIGSTPPAYVDELLILHRQMEQDVPRGELSREPVDLDLERLHTSQQRLADTGWTAVTSLVLVGGEAAGYTQVLVHRDDEVIVQVDTLVLPAHRGRRFGQLLKTANLHRLEPVRDGRTWLQTFTEINPITHVVSAERGLIHGTASGSQIGWALLATAALTLLFAPLAIRLQARRS